MGRDRSIERANYELEAKIRFPRVREFLSSPSGTGSPSFVSKKKKVTLRLTVNQSIIFRVDPHMGLMTRF
jgi:hypothetical protein